MKNKGTKKSIRNINYKKALIICHGKSEMQIARYITTNLRLPVEVYAKKKGESSIQITSLGSLLKRGEFADPESFCEEFGAELVGKGSRLALSPDFKVYIIMDTDDCTAKQKADFMNGKMFQKHWLSSYIVPIYNITNLEDVMCKAGIMVKRIKEYEKGTYYAKVFPIGNGKNNGTKEEISSKFRDPIAAIKPDPLAYTNMHLMVDDLFKLIK